MEDSANAKLSQFKTRKTWNEKKSGHKCMMIYARSLYIYWSGYPCYWVWDCYKETSDENIEVARLIKVCALHVTKSFEMSGLTEGVEYEIAFVVKLTKGAYGWEFPIYLSLKLPNQTEKQRGYSLHDKPTGEWMELSGGTFKATRAAGEGHLELRGSCPQWKSGLIIKGIIIRPKH